MEYASSQAPVEVALVAVEETSVAVLYGLQEVFAAVGVVWDEITGEGSGGRRMRPHIVARSAGTYTNTSGLPICADASFDDSTVYDIVVAIDLALDGALDPRERWPAASAWLARQYEEGALACSVCTGTVLLAEVGLLDGRAATTHWAICGVLEKLYPQVRMVPEEILAVADPDQRIVTSGGASAWSDLALHLIARHCGREEAVRIAKVFLFGDRADGQLPFAAMTRPQQHEDAVIGRCQTWLADNYDTPGTVARMVEYSGLAPRTFKRRFRRATGRTPIEYVQMLRVEEAKQILETSDAAPDDVAGEVGYEDPASFRRIFKRIAGTTPAAYRRRYAGLGKVGV